MRRLAICLALGVLGPAEVCRAQGAATIETETVESANAEPSSVGHDAVRRRLESVLADPGFQTELPGVVAGSEGEGSSSTTARQRRRREFAGAPPDRAQPRFEMRIPEAGTLAKITLGAFVVAMLVTALGSFIVESRRHRRSQGIAPEPEPRPPTSRPTRGESPEVLASSGCYTEAVHLILGQALGRLVGGLTLPPGLRRSLTSREILARPELASRREALAILVETVERSWFGGSTVDRESYERCLEASRRLSLPSAVEPVAEPG